MKKFYLIWLLLVLGIMGCDNGELLESRMAANEARTIGTIRYIFQAQQQFRVFKKGYQTEPFHKYALSFAELKKNDLLDSVDSVDSKGQNSNYQFKMKVSKLGFQLVAYPLTPDDGGRSFYTDDSGVITYSEDPNVMANKKSASLD